MPPTMPGYRYGCHGRAPRDTPSTLSVQDGWTPDGRRIMVEIPVTPIAGVTCGHLARESDPACDGCQNQAQRK